MPTSPRDLTGRTGGYKRSALLSNLRADVGISPYASGKRLPFIRVRSLPVGVPSTPVRAFGPATLSKQERAFFSRS